VLPYQVGYISHYLFLIPGLRICIDMPASSSESVTPVEASLRASLGGKDSLDQQLAASSTKVLLQKIDFAPAQKSCSFQPESIKAKYVLLNPSKTPSESLDGKTPKKMNRECISVFVHDYFLMTRSKVTYFKKSR
jgi:hypothetical protein